MNLMLVSEAVSKGIKQEYIRSSYRILPGMHTMLSSLAATRASSPKNRNLYPTSTISIVSMCFRLISRNCSSIGVSFPVFDPFFLALVPTGASSSSGSASASSSSPAAAPSCAFKERQAKASGWPNFLTNFLCSSSLFFFVASSSSSLPWPVSCCGFESL